MKKKFLLPLIVIAAVSFSPNVSAQNADEIITNPYLPQFNYVGGSFVIDTGVSQANAKRAFLIWANNLQSDSINRYMSLSEYDPNLNFLTEQGNTSEKFGSVKNMFPKKIIRSKFAHVYYVLGYVINSNHKINGFKVNSSPTLYKIDGNTLGLIWARKINLSVITATNINTVIDYNDIIETRDKNIVLVGKYAVSTQAKESVLATKINGSTGNLIWRYVYKTGNNCNEGANSVAETKDGKLSLTGYVKKCVVGQGFGGNSDVFYLETQSNGIPVAGIYTRFFWPSNLNMWGDKITCYTASSGTDQLIISGYVDVLDVTGATNRQILILNVKQNGIMLTAHHVGDPKTDVCNDLIFSKVAGTNGDYLIYLTGQTSNYNSQITVSAEAYFMSAKFNAVTGVGALGEFSTFPVTAAPYNTYRSRNGLEIKNAGDYREFAILATGVYKPTTNSTQTYTNVLVRDFGDASGNCIKQQQPPIMQFNPDRASTTVSFDTPAIKLYKESWTKLSKLDVKELCQAISIDPTRALNVKSGNDQSSQSLQSLRITPNPARSVIQVSIADGSALTGKYNNATIKIYNNLMQAEKIIPVTSAQGLSAQVAVAQLKAGMYTVQLIRGDQVLYSSFIKE